MEEGGSRRDGWRRKDRDRARKEEEGNSETGRMWHRMKMKM